MPAQRLHAQKRKNYVIITVLSDKTLDNNDNNIIARVNGVFFFFSAYKNAFTAHGVRTSRDQFEIIYVLPRKPVNFTVHL